ncbi:hypothetical protein [Flavisolibacter tropicus]|uniref:Muconolactone isomerase domain-containing protein n=1 Tax=Flavisolibacter tropicus TaxID=1492898 RepID=A0A172U286_9BACT|nr:hypothetical protein [Flavisolibacter tropicus]ANE53117.1 hypothetical protein SY85_24240 [Flavisolibacter tropicus]
MSKFLVTVQFTWSDEMALKLEEHRTYINSLIEEQIIEHYAVSMEVQQVWITINADSKKEVEEVLSVSPLYKYWKLEVWELVLWDGLSYRLPALQLN